MAHLAPLQAGSHNYRFHARAQDWAQGTLTLGCCRASFFITKGSAPGVFGLT